MWQYKNKVYTCKKYKAQSFDIFLLDHSKALLPLLSLELCCFFFFYPLHVCTLCTSMIEREQRKSRNVLQHNAELWMNPRVSLQAPSFCRLRGNAGAWSIACKPTGKSFFSHTGNRSLFVFLSIFSNCFLFFLPFFLSFLFFFYLLLDCWTFWNERYRTLGSSLLVLTDIIGEFFEFGKLSIIWE